MSRPRSNEAEDVARHVSTGHNGSSLNGWIFENVGPMGHERSTVPSFLGGEGSHVICFGIFLMLEESGEILLLDKSKLDVTRHDKSSIGVAKTGWCVDALETGTIE